jgi:hypothetical protein
MYTVGARAVQADSLTQTPATVQTAGGQVVPVSYSTALRPVAAPSIASTAPAHVTRRAPAPRRPVNRTVSNAQRETVYEEDVREDRSWGKTAMIVGGSAASGAGVGGIVGGKKGALIGAAIGGGAASIYEATQRR